MDGEPMPDSIKELFRQDQSSLDGDDHPTQKKMDRFIRNFGVSPNLIMYHVAHGERNEDHKFHVEVKEQDIKPNMRGNLGHEMIVVPKFTIDLILCVVGKLSLSGICLVCSPDSCKMSFVGKFRI
ncbi:hypothetical protein SLA2020_028400 [Shorea laevis]